MDVMRFDARDGEGTFVVHFGVKEHQISANTLSNSLKSFSEVLRICSELVEPSTEFEVNVLAISPGSFRITLSPKTKEFMQSVWQNGGKEFVVAVVAGVLVVKLAGGEVKHQTNIYGDVIINNNNYEVVVPASCAEQFEKAVSDEKLDESIAETFETIEADVDVQNFGLTNDINDEIPRFLINRDKFAVLTRRKEQYKTEKEITRRMSVRVLKAVFERGTRKWEFVTCNTKISAPMLDDDFFNSLVEHDVMLGVGDTLDVTIKVKQKWNDLVEQWIDEGYKIEKVHSHTARSHQHRLM